jgi:hypothetical protein
MVLLLLCVLLLLPLGFEDTDAGVGVVDLLNVPNDPKFSSWFEDEEEVDEDGKGPGLPKGPTEINKQTDERN